eukprot:gene12579-14545_t
MLGIILNLPLISQESGRGNAFGRLLKDATNQIRTEYDTQVAIDFTVNEALVVMKDWARETEDKEIAAKLAKQLEEEDQKSRKEELTKGEAAALKVAIDETRRVKAEAKDREVREKTDAEYAKAIYEAEEKDAKQFEQILEDDAKLARQLSDDDESKWESKSDHAEEKGSSYGNADSKASRDSKHDEKEDEEAFLRAASAKFEQLDADMEVAEREQRLLDRERLEKERAQLTKDFLLSRRLAVKTEREAHKLRKYKDMQRTFERCQRGNEAVANLWNSCEAEVDDVCDAVCITLLLPNILDLKVKVVKNGRKVSIDAKRFVQENDRFASSENTSYVAEFKIQGKNVQISDTSVSHEYTSDTGLLHIYIEGVSLEANEATNNERTDYNDALDMKNKEGSAKSAATSGTSAKMIAQAVKSGFMRVFGGSSA